MSFLQSDIRYSIPNRPFFQNEFPVKRDSLFDSPDPSASVPEVSAPVRVPFSVWGSVVAPLTRGIVVNEAARQ
jgi:hypothetical protein